MIEKSRVVGFVILAGLSAASGPLLAQEEQEREKLLAAVDQVIHNQEKREAAIQAGRERILLCSQCHGEDGNSRVKGVPNLAGQNPGYLLQQVERFADGRRKDFVMQSLSRSFTMDDKLNIAVYFSSMAIKPVSADPVLAAEGARIYNAQCQRCHGADGRGEAGFARLAGQQPEYVVTTLKRFRDNAQGKSEDPANMRRHDALMEQMTQNMKDRDIEGVAAYLALLNK